MYFRQDLGLNPAWSGLILEFEREKGAFLAWNGFEMYFEQEMRSFSARNGKGQPIIYFWVTLWSAFERKTGFEPAALSLGS